MRDWSKWITQALVRRTDLPLHSIHMSSVFSALGILTLERQYLLDKLAGIMDKLTNTDELRTVYRRVLGEAIKREATAKATEVGDQDVEQLRQLAEVGLRIKLNDKACWVAELDRAGEGINEVWGAGEEIQEHQDTSVQTRDTWSLWKGEDGDDHEKAVVCTDGSTDPNDTQQMSGAAVTLITRRIKAKEYICHGAHSGLAHGYS